MSLDTIEDLEAALNFLAKFDMSPMLRPDGVWGVDGKPTLSEAVLSLLRQCADGFTDRGREHRAEAIRMDALAERAWKLLATP